MINPNSYLRRADLDTSIKVRIDTLRAEAAKCHAQGMDAKATVEDLTVNVARLKEIDAQITVLDAVLQDMDAAQQFTYRSFTEYGDSGRKYNSLVEAARNRVPLDPFQDDDVDPAIAA